MKQPIIEVEAGILLCGRIRDYLEACKWNGADIEWREGKGWMSRTFIIRGNPSDLQNIGGTLEQLVSRNPIG